MMNARAYLHLAMALILMSLTCDVGAVCAMASSDEECCCSSEGMSSPCTDMSGDEDAPSGPESAATVGSGERFSQAILAPAPGISPPGAPRPTLSGRIDLAAANRTTPLYLSHCSFLC